MAGLQKPLIRSMLEIVLLVAELSCAHLSYWVLGVSYTLVHDQWQY